MNFTVFIRNVMIGRKGLSQEVLLTAFLEGGAEHARSILATGNVVFSAAPENATQIVGVVADLLEKRVGLLEPMFVRSLEHLQASVARQPFLAAPEDNIYERCLTFLPRTCSLDLPIVSSRNDCVIFAAEDADVYSITRLVNNRPGQPGKLIEQQTKLLCTTRNWNTIKRICAA